MFLLLKIIVSYCHSALLMTIRIHFGATSDRVIYIPQIRKKSRDESLAYLERKENILNLNYIHYFNSQNENYGDHNTH